VDSSQALSEPRRRALVVDDDPAVRALLTDFLEQQDFEVRTSQDGRTGLTVFHAEHFDLILVDFQMPDMTGLEMATEVRQTDPDIPIALITGMAHTLDTTAVIQAGISRIFPKPISLEELAVWIHSLPL
jgi:DNA-binding response OmpR family regulator